MKLVGRRIMVNSALLNAIVIAVGAAIGANLRYSLSLWAAQRWGASFPYGTLIVNVIGSFLIGLVLVLATTRLNLSDLARLLIVTGLLGGFTTFSSLSFETYSLIVSGSWRTAGIYLASSFGLGMAGVFLGAGVARLLP
ncbi:MAG: putative fluoride ion transporter CrcB [Roseiflexus sp.]|nr:fluoride efflux transporter CrcB [Roseiflexus sp.]GIW01904.1 MAG: putative fluoride ion transporter CrcB [Roseiflexus sp.]